MYRKLQFLCCFINHRNIFNTLIKGKKTKDILGTIQFLSSLLIFHLVDFFMD